MEDNTRKVEAVIKGVTADRKQLILSIGNVEMTATRNFTSLFAATDLRSSGRTRQGSKDTCVKSFDTGSQRL